LIPAILLNDGATIPHLGFGTLWMLPERDELRGSSEATAEGEGGRIERSPQHVRSDP
jgi:hypothetical protein